MLNNEKLKQAQAQFFMAYPGGFTHPEMVKIGKKHNMEKLIHFAQESFSPEACTNIHLTAENMIKLVSRSSMVSMFEKPKFRDFIQRLNNDEKAYLVNALRQLLHGDQQTGFTNMVDFLATEKLAKWSLVTVIPAYYAPTTEVFVKPTTTKGVIAHFNLVDLKYKPKPAWEFYQSYRDMVNAAKTQVDESLSPSNAAFLGFLMMTMPTT